MSQSTFPKSWVLANIDSVSLKCEQRTPKDDESFTYVDIGSVDRDLKTIAEPQYLFGKEAPSRARKVINFGDVLVSLTRPNLNAVAYVDKKYDDQIASTGFEVIKPLINSKYIFGLVRSRDFIESISEKVQGALYPAAKSTDVREFEFGLPPLAEQQQIAQKLDELLAQVDTLKNRLDAIPKILKRFRQSVLAAAVSGRLTEEWRSNCSVEFDSWEKTDLGSVSNVATGKTPKRDQNEYWDNGTIAWLTSSATGNAFTYEAEQFVTEFAVKDCGLKIFQEGTLLLAMYGEGKTRGQVTELKISAACNQACAAITVNEIKISRKFVKLVLQENYEETRKVAVGGAQPNLNLNKVREIPVLVPLLEEQSEIVRRVEQLFAYADQIEQRVKDAQARVNHLIPSILAKAFRGELTAEWRAQNPELISGENSAAALLERIKAEREAIAKPKKKMRA